jgi:hypothetical protein
VTHERSERPPQPVSQNLVRASSGGRVRRVYGRGVSPLQPEILPASTAEEQAT